MRTYFSTNCDDQELVSRACIEANRFLNVAMVFADQLNESGDSENTQFRVVEAIANGNLRNSMQ